MTQTNRVTRSINMEGNLRCVDIFKRPDETFGFEEYRRDPEDGRGWFPVGFYNDRSFGTEAEALSDAENAVSWLTKAFSG